MAVAIGGGDKNLDFPRLGELADGEVRSPALAIELKLESGFEEEGLRSEGDDSDALVMLGDTRIELVTEVIGLEIATGSFDGCIGLAMNSDLDGRPLLRRGKIRL